jgi:hypothetical protein
MAGVAGSAFGCVNGSSEARLNQTCRSVRKGSELSRPAPQTRENAASLRVARVGASAVSRLERESAAKRDTEKEEDMYE